jgi:hypothetical protein
MPSTIIASPQLSTGGLVLLSQNASFQDDGAHDYKAEYACLTQFANLHTGKFVKGAQPPIARPPHMARSNVRLYDISIESDKGITYFRAAYGGFDTTVERSETEEVKSFAASRTLRFTNTTIYYRLSFDYVAKAVTRTSKSGYLFTDLQPGEQLVGLPFNIKRNRSVEGTQVNFTNNNFPVLYKKDVVVQRSNTRAANGVTTYSTTSTGVYVEV